MATVRTAVIPAAGMGTRMRPATDTVPKELLPVGRRPAIEWVLDEARDAGIERIVVVSSRDKPAIREHLEGHSDRFVAIDVVFQDSAHGLGDAVRVGAKAVGDEPFAVLLPDEILLGKGRLLTEMIDASSDGRSVVSVLRVPRSEIASYGCAVVGDGDPGPGRIEITGCVEKPAPEDAPSEFALSGRYVIGRDVLSRLGDLGEGCNGERGATGRSSSPTRCGTQPRRAASPVWKSFPKTAASMSGPGAAGWARTRGSSSVPTTRAPRPSRLRIPCESATAVRPEAAVPEGQQGRNIKQV